MTENLRDLFQRMMEVKLGMKTAIEDKGGIIYGGIESYWRSIEGLGDGLDWSGVPELMDYIGYSYSGVGMDWYGGESDLPIKLIDVDDETPYMITEFGWARADSDPECLESRFAWQEGMTKCGSINTDIYRENGVQFNCANMFADCRSLYAAPYIDLRNCWNTSKMFEMFEDETPVNLLYVPFYDLSSVTQCIRMFSDCSNLLYLPDFDLSNCVNAYGMLQRCTSLKVCPKFKMDKVENVSNMLQGCKSLEEGPKFKMDKVKDVSYFLSETELKHIDLTHTSPSIERCDHMFYNNPQLELVDMSTWDLSNARGVEGMFRGCPNLQSVKLGVLPKLGYSMDLGFRDCPKLSVDSIVGIFQNSLQELGEDDWGDGFILGSVNLAKLSDDQIEMATDKGWYLH